MKAPKTTTKPKKSYDRDEPVEPEPKKHHRTPASKHHSTHGKKHHANHHGNNVKVVVDKYGMKHAVNHAKHRPHHGHIKHKGRIADDSCEGKKEPHEQCDILVHRDYCRSHKNWMNEFCCGKCRCKSSFTPL